MSTTSAVAVIDRDEPMELRPMPALPTAQRLALALPSMEELKVLQAYGEMFAASGLFPNVTTWQAAAAIIQYGSQLGIDAFTALKDIYWIKGKPSCDASLINSLIKRDHGGDALMPVESTAERCTIKFKRRDWDHYEESTVTLADYQHLVNDKTRVTWQQAPKDMLWARNVSQIGRRHFSDTIKGLYTREEMSDANVIEARVRVIERPTPALATDNPDPGVDTTPAIVASSPASDRAAEAKALASPEQIKALVDIGKRKRLGIDDVAILMGGEGWETRVTHGQAAERLAWLQGAKTEQIDAEMAAALERMEAEAGRLIDAARRLHGEFARLNFPREGEQQA